eukprot:300075_1
MTHWHSLSPFTPIRNASYGRIKLGRRVKMQFKFIYHSPSQEYNSTLSNYYENIFRIGYGHELNTFEGAGSRYPSMWIIYNKNEIPHAEFSISDIISTWRKYPPYHNNINNNIFSITKEQIYKCNIEFNQTYVSISLNNITYNINRPAETNINILNNSNMIIWIAQFGHDNNPSPIANVTLFDIDIQTFDHLTQSPTISPTQNPIEYIISTTVTTPIQTILIEMDEMIAIGDIINISVIVLDNKLYQSFSTIRHCFCKVFFIQKLFISINQKK